MNTNTSTARSAARSRNLAGATIGVAILALLAGCMLHAAPPADLDLSTSKLTDQGLYRGTIQPQIDPIQINKLHSWTLKVETRDGAPVAEAAISVDGDMPQHGHGLPTRPRVSRHLGEGRFEVEGMKFNMPGWWIVSFSIRGPAGADEVTFNLVL